jgi:hypothetical protein
MIINNIALRLCLPYSEVMLKISKRSYLKSVYLSVGLLRSAPALAWRWGLSIQPLWGSFSVSTPLGRKLSKMIRRLWMHRSYECFIEYFTIKALYRVPRCKPWSLLDCWENSVQCEKDWRYRSRLASKCIIRSHNHFLEYHSSLLAELIITTRVTIPRSAPVNPPTLSLCTRQFMDGTKILVNVITQVSSGTY